MQGMMLFEGQGVNVVASYRPDSQYGPKRIWRYVLDNGRTLQISYWNATRKKAAVQGKGLPLSVTRDTQQPESQRTGDSDDEYVTVLFDDGTEYERLEAEYDYHSNNDLWRIQQASETEREGKSPDRTVPEWVTLPKGKFYEYDIPESDTTIAVNGTARRLLAIRRVDSEGRRHRDVTFILEQGHAFGIQWHEVPDEAHERAPRIPDEIRDLTSEEAARMDAGEAGQKRMAVYRTAEPEDRKYVMIRPHNAEDRRAIAVRYGDERKRVRSARAARESDRDANPLRGYGDLKPLDEDWSRVTFRGEGYHLRDKQQAIAFLKFLGEHKAFNRESGRDRDEACEHVQEVTGKPRPQEYKPISYFKPTESDAHKLYEKIVKNWRRHYWLDV